jgi:hypothetical protein
MSSTRERLAELERADFDSFGEQNKGPGEFPLATPEEVDAILEAVKDHAWEDPTRYQDAFRILYVAAASIASGYVPGREQHRATQALREVMQRVVIGEMQAEVDHHG